MGHHGISAKLNAFFSDSRKVFIYQKLAIQKFHTLLRLDLRQFQFSSDLRNCPTSSLNGTELSEQFLDRNWTVWAVPWSELHCLNSSLNGTELFEQFFERNWTVWTVFWTELNCLNSSLIGTELSEQFLDRNWTVWTVLRSELNCSNSGDQIT